MKKNIAPLIIFILPFFHCQGQSKKQVVYPINNKTIDFRVIRTATKLLDSNRIELSQTLIDVSLSKSTEIKIMRLKYDDWMRLLSAESTDWAANLCLYEIYKRDALLFRTEKGRTYWVNCCKQEDIKFWKKELLK